eukprot:3884548-Lingulodinium_polyedra.AAC.1
MRVASPLEAFPTRSIYCADRRLSLQYLGETILYETILVADLPRAINDLPLDGLRSIVETCAAFIDWSGA